MDGQAIVFFEIARSCTRLAQRGLDALSGCLSDVLVERAGAMPGRQDALDGLDVERAVPNGAPKGCVETVGFVALAEQQNAPGCVTPETLTSRAEALEELGGVFAHLFESGAKLVEISGGSALGAGVKAVGVEGLCSATRSELVARDATEIGGVDEQLALRDAYREQIGDVVVGHGVPVALVVDEAIDAAEAVGDARRVVRVGRQRQQMRLFLGKALQSGGAALGAMIDDPLEPVGELRVEVVAVAK